MMRIGVGTCLGRDVHGAEADRTQTIGEERAKAIQGGLFAHTPTPMQLGPRHRKRVTLGREDDTIVGVRMLFEIDQTRTMSHFFATSSIRDHP